MASKAQRVGRANAARPADADDTVDLIAVTGATDMPAYQGFWQIIAPQGGVQRCLPR
jgi:hypothetical protein